nr:EOG090X0LFN [Eulimnadia texana]
MDPRQNGPFLSAVAKPYNGSSIGLPDWQGLAYFLHPNAFKVYCIFYVDPQPPAVPSADNGQGNPSNAAPSNLARREWIMNPAGKSYVCILHEYVQHALKKQPCYQFKEIENAATPYSATVLINGMQYGTGVGSSKKAAKAEAAKATLDVLIPQMREKILSDTQPGTRGPSHSADFFDDIRIEDPRVAELCAKTSEPSPYAILLTCLQRNFGLGDKNVKYELKTLKHQRNEVTMTVGKHTVSVHCKNKRDGKQRAAQAILQLGSLLRLYGSHSLKSVKEKKQEEQQITLLQSKAAVNAPNVAILNKLREEMLKLRERRSRSRSPRRNSSRRDRSRDRYSRNSDSRRKFNRDRGTEEQNAQQHQQPKPAAGVPSYYNPAVVNVTKVAEQMQKRKLLWGNKEKKEAAPTATVWNAATFSQDQDGKATAKFKRLMGIKEDGSSGSEAATDVSKKQQELFATLDQQYEIARATTHTQRGVGLGFSSGYSFPR